MRDVAARAQASISTVANVVNGRTGRMDPRLLDRVQSAIAELGYHPNQMARSFKTGSTPLLGLLLPSISNPAYSVLAREIEVVASNSHGFRVLIGNSYRDKDKERGFLTDLLGHGVRGVIVVSPLLDMDYYRDFIDRGLVVVSYDRRFLPETNLKVDYVSVDNFRAADLATTHLIENGHTALAYCTPSLMTVARSEKIKGFNAAAQRASLSSTSHVIRGQVTAYYEDEGLVQLGADMAQQVFQMTRRPTALVAMNDLMAIGLVSGLRTLGLHVPEDMSIVGMDDVFLSEIIYPGITTVRSPLDMMARTMVDRLVQRLAKNELKTSEFMFAPDLVVRRSVRKVDAPTN